MKRLRFAAALLLLTALVMPCRADEGATVVQSSCSIMEAENSVILYCYAQVYNGTGNVVCMEEGQFELRSGDDILATGSVEQMTPYFLRPGEEGYLYDAVVLDSAGEEEDGSLAVLLHLSNPHKEEAWSPTMAFGLYTEGGALLYCDGRTLENVGIPSGGEMTVRFDVSRSFAERWAEYGADPAEVRATADCGGDD